MKFLKIVAATFLATLLTGLTTAHATVKLNTIFTDNMVLQRGVDVPVWGTAKDGENVTVKFEDQTVTTTAKNGLWMIRLKPLQPGGPFTMTVTGENTITLGNVLVGEVWVASGQSNMAFQLARASNAATAVPNANDPQLRFFTVGHGAADEPKIEVVGHWKGCTSETASNFSAVAYFFGRDLRQTLKVPVGMIDSSVGGTPAEAWVSRATLENDPELKNILVHYAESIKQFEAQAAAAPKKKSKSTKAKAASTDPRHAGKRPSCLYNAMIAPLQPYAIAGVIWYQGEANSARAAEYQILFPALIRNWRQAWGQGEFPFLFEQIAPHERMSPEIREAQLLTSQKVPRTAMAVNVDYGNATDIHPKDKEPVGHRLALAARALAYGEKIEYSGPVYDSLKIEDSKAILSFTHTGSGLVAHGGELKGFTIAGVDGNFTNATAKIGNNKVIVSAPSVTKPVSVRYGWASVPDVNLFNQEGLPASPFRTDTK